VQGSFFGTAFCSDKEAVAGNTLCISKAGDAVWAKIRPKKPMPIRILLPQVQYIGFCRLWVNNL